MSAIVSNTSPTARGASPADGSSSSRTAGSDIMARAMASIWRSPPESVPARWRRRSPSRGKRAIISPIRSRVWRRRSTPPTSRFSCTVSDAKTLPTWGT